MGWTDSLRYFKGAAANHGIDSLKKQQRSDDGLPLKAKIGSLVQLQISPFIRASGAGSLVSGPTEDDTVIRAIAHVKLDYPGDIYRYYLSVGDDGEESEKFIQVVQNDQGDIVELMYCSRLVRFIPETVEDQQAFTGENGEGLGQKTYTLWRDQLSEYGFADTVLTPVFGDNEQLDYIRDTGDGDYVPPFNGSEIRIDDAQGVHGQEQDIWFVPYVRSLSDGSQEFLLITTSVVKSHDGDNSKRSIFVDFMVGILIEKERITIQ
ncbi:DUF2491 family protein [Undibacterium sp. RTI2.1]|uniref:DUF2491 family protein n=1 Tax=unclassified Undibacterium TaxID=2630295 RepID=UPI002AB5D4EB|nr:MULTISPECIES: DUF2491 family protein [unclassified Undibacterium]MDY7540726.1 DUF2491 family protein [Undibacterium sp. 5I1]MEB0032678.1 DUF2491 family protein [Undibacterium sp. RTI2.1]MEB0118682.1 DUF2491 family protein [Undibacterium sp. RTI2.2]MEB0232652.1 DUF2491 family protein [Undibacterium sp. 10I3]MEB0259637.1 DUF2491 family protein [Undibacterium sp. 5I1]